MSIRGSSDVQPPSLGGDALPLRFVQKMKDGRQAAPEGSSQTCSGMMAVQSMSDRSLHSRSVDF
jgi:hypothetical protein